MLKKRIISIQKQKIEAVNLCIKLQRLIFFYLIFYENILTHR